MKIGKQFITIIALFALIPNGTFAQVKENIVNSEEKNETNSIVRVEAKNVCMGMATNRVFMKELIPAVVEGKTYYGCCKGCQSKLLEDHQSRVAIDSINGTVADKATAVIGTLPSGVVHYFETEETMHQFAELIQSTEHDHKITPR